MKYSINKLARLAGVSTRTLRYYDQLGLLCPARVSTNGYRVYGRAEVDRLQQILFYRELGVELGEIKRLLSAEDFDRLAALEGHLGALQARRAQLDGLIANVQKTIQEAKGCCTMTDQERFEGFKQNMIEQNEARYGPEIRAKYGDAAVDGSHAKLMGLTPEQYARLEALTAQVNDALRAAVATGDPAGAAARELCALHRDWLCFHWTEYSPEAHLGVAQMYVDDERFAAYYDAIVPGGAGFLRDAVAEYCQ